jgi:type VI protein secretion system component VasF
MEDKKIDLLFQEKLKNLEATPNKKVWNRIESQLKKKKRRVLPIWWYAGGVAATLVLGFLLFPFGKDSETNKQPIIIASPESSPKK